MLILNLHGIGTPNRELPPSEQRVWLSGLQFESFLNYVKTLRGIQLTFDDANESDYTIALPALQDRGMKAKFFIVADRVGKHAFLSSKQLNELLSGGMEIGNHGMRHRPWAGLCGFELQEELVEAKDRLEQMTGAKIDKASCPFGSYNRRILFELQKAGYKHIYTSDCGHAQEHNLIQPRNSVYRNWGIPTLSKLAEQPAYATRLWRQLKLAAKRWR